MMNIYEITNETYSAKINLSRGANCISLRNRQYHASILREPDYSKPLDNPYLYGMPVLSPVNRISGGRFVFEGRDYIFPVNEPHTNCHLHGELHEQEFQIVSAGKDFVVCAYQALEEHQYFGGQNAFEVVISYRLTAEGLEQKTEVKNLSSQNMPVMIGFHTTFRIPFMEDQDVADLRILTDVSDLIERNMDTYLPTGNILEPDEITEKLKCGEFKPFEQKISRHYKSSGAGRMCIRDMKNNVTVQYENSTNMGFRLIYNGHADEYICMEPQNCLVNYMNEAFDWDYAGFEYLKSGDSKVYVSKITMGGRV